MVSKKLLSLCIVVSTMCAASCMDSVQGGVKEKNKEEKIEIDSSLSAQALYGKGKYYYYDLCEYRRALAYFEKAAIKDHREAQFFVALMYFYGYGCDKDLLKAFKSCRVAAKRGNYNAQSLLSEIRDELLIELAEDCEGSGASLPLEAFLNAYGASGDKAVNVQDKGSKNPNKKQDDTWKRMFS